MKRMVWLLLLSLLLVLTCAAAEGPTFVQTFSNVWPDDLREALPAQWTALQPACGQFCEIEGDWTCGQAIVYREGKTELAAFRLTADGWQVQSSSEALPQAEPCSLWTPAVAEGWDAEQILDFGGCEEFDVITPLHRYSWSAAGNGWQLVRVIGQYANITVTPSLLLYNGEAVFNTQPVTLAAFRASTFPDGIIEARQLAEESGLNDTRHGILNASARETDGSATIPLFSAPSVNAPVLAWYFEGVEVEISDEGSGFLHVNIGEMSGWMQARHVLRGADCAGVSASGGAAGWIAAYGTERYHLLRSLAEADAAPCAQLGCYLPVRVLCVLSDTAWLQVDLEDGTRGFLPVQDVSRGEAWTHSSEPANRVYLRADALKRAQSLGSYFGGVKAELLFHPVAEDWIRVSIEGTPGWIQKEYLVSSPEMAGLIPPMATVHTTNQAPLKLRAAMSYEALVLASPANGVRAELLGINGSWAHVRLRSGMSGYVQTEFLDGDFSRALLPVCTAKTALSLQTLDGEATVDLPAGMQMTLTAGRTRREWRLTANGPVFDESERTRVYAAGYAGTVETELTDQGW